MTEPNDDAAVGAFVRELVSEGDDDELRLMSFHEHVQSVPGPVGELLRQVAHAHDGFVAAVHQGGTTAGEETRLFGVLDVAVSLVERWKDGGTL